MAFESSGENYTVGKGRGYFDRKDKADHYEGERKLGNIAFMSATVDMDKRNHYNNKGSFRFVDKSAVVAVTPKISVTLDEISVENLALLFLAEVREIEQAASGEETMSIERAKVRPGFVIDLGKRFLDADSFTVSDSSGFTYTSGTDYQLDARSGKMQVCKGGALTGTEDLIISYKLKAQKYKELDNFQRSTIEGRFTYVSDNAAGKNFIIEFWHVSFTLSGNAVLLTDRTEWMRIELEGEIQADEKGHPDSPFGRTLVIE